MRVIVIAAALAAAGCGSARYGSGTTTTGPACTAANATATTSVALVGLEFVPACVKVAPGATITFTNEDAAVVHTVTADAGQAPSFDSGNLAQGQQFVQTFPAAGTVSFHCIFHATMGMRGTVFVQ